MAARALPNWPRVLRAKMAADYAGYGSERDFRVAVASGDMPVPFTLGNAEAWDITEINEAVDAIKAGGVSAGNWRKEAESYAAGRRVAGRRDQAR